MAKEDLKWFQKIGCESMRVIEYNSMGERKILNERTVKDKEFIRFLQQFITTIPVLGDENIRIGPGASYMVAEFTCGGKTTEIIEFINSRIKTPSTAFLSNPNDVESKVLNDFKALLRPPTYNQHAPKITNNPLKYPDFEITYLKSEDRTPKDTTATLNVESYKVKSTKGEVQTVEVRSGQLPPKDVTFKVNEKSFDLITFAREGLQLHPNLLVVREAKGK